MNVVAANRFKSANKCDMVMQQLQDLIIKNVYKQGDRLPTEDQLCTMFGVSRITVREALKKLSTMGLVSIQQGKGTFVQGVDLGSFMQPLLRLIDFNQLDVRTIYDARLCVETGTVRFAAQNRTEEDIKKMRAILAHFEEAVMAGDILHVSELDTQYHVYLTTAAKNSVLEATIITLEDITTACLKRMDKYLTMLNNASLQHTKILDAIENRDPDEAERYMRIHTLESQKLLMN